MLFTVSNSLRILILLSGCSLLSAVGQQVAPKSAAEGKPATQEQAKADSNKLPAERGDVVDRVAAIVNGDLVLESDVEEEERFTRLYPYGDGQGKSLREQALTRIIDRSLIHQQQAGFVQAPVSDEDVTREENDMRKDLPTCSTADCKTDSGWTKFLTRYGFTRDELRARLRLRIQLLNFVATRFRSGVRISDRQISDFYNKTMLPEYAKQGTTAPPLDTVSDRIEQVLQEQQVGVLLDEWLKSLRDSGHVRVMQQGKEAP